LLDGRGFSPTPVHRATSGLLCDEHVERIRSLGGDRVGENAAAMAASRCKFGRCNGTGVAVGAVALLLARLPQASAASQVDQDSSWTTWHALQRLPLPAWWSLRPMLVIITISLVISSLVALYFISTQRPRLACISLAVAMFPIGLCLIDGVARVAPQFSLADAARFLNARLGQRDEVIYEGALESSSSLVFYLHRRFYLVNEPPDDEMHIAAHDGNVSLNEEAVLREWGRSRSPRMG